VLPERTSLLAVTDPLVEIVHLESGDQPEAVRALLLSLAPAPVTVELSGAAGQPSKFGTFLGEMMEPVSGGRLTLQPGDYVAVELTPASKVG
jgi:hypothetical protein